MNTLVKKIILFIPNKLIAINDNVDRLINLPTTTDKTFPYVTKVTGAAKGVVDLAEALGCQNGGC